MIQLAFYINFLILLFSIMGKIIYDYLKGRKLKYAFYGIALVSWLIIFVLLKFVLSCKKLFHLNRMFFKLFFSLIITLIKLIILVNKINYA